MDTYAAPLHQHPNKDALGRPQHILRRVRTCLLDAFPKQLPLPSFWAPGKPHAAELPSAKGDRVERAAGQDGSWGARRGLHAEGGKPPSRHCSLLSCKCSHLPKPAKASWNKFRDLEKAGFYEHPAKSWPRRGGQHRARSTCIDITASLFQVLEGMPKKH